MCRTPVLTFKRMLIYRSKFPFSFDYVLNNSAGILSCFLRLFETIDNNGDGLVERKELRLVLAVAFVEGEGNQSAEMSSNQIMEEYDVNHDEKITFDEFLNGLQKWSIELNQEKLNRVSFSFKSFSVFVFVGILNFVLSFLIFSTFIYAGFST